MVLYIEPSPGVNYTFTYFGFTMYVTSSNQEYMKTIRKTPKRKRKLKAEGGKKAFVYQRGSTRETVQAQQRYLQLQNKKY